MTHIDALVYYTPKDIRFVKRSGISNCSGIVVFLILEKKYYLKYFADQTRRYDPACQRHPIPSHVARSIQQIIFSCLFNILQRT